MGSRIALSVLVALAAACVSNPEPANTPEPTPPLPTTGRDVLRNARLPGGAPIALVLAGGRITALGPTVTSTPGDRVHDLGGAFVAPAFIDGHVHLAYLPAAEALADGGVAGAVDLAAPLTFAPERATPLIVRWAGPMITAVDGYPTLEWGSDGYGLECADGVAAEAAVDALVARGVHVIKVPVSSGRGLDDAALAAVVARAHQHGRRVVAHALRDEDVLRAGRAGVDVLGHTPLEPLSAEAVAAFADRAVVSTLSAFGGSSDAVENLRRLRGAGARVLYGTDFGNTRTAGIQAEELRLLAAAGLDAGAILRAGTTEAATFWGFEALGALEVGRRASLLVLDRDPLDDPQALAAPREVWIDGARR